MLKAMPTEAWRSSGRLLPPQPGVGCFRGEHGRYFGAADPLPQLSCYHTMATQAEGPDIVEVALPAAFRDRQNVICIPKTLAHSCRESPMPHERQANGAPGAFELAVLPDGVQPAVNAYAPVALQDLVAQIPWLRTELPFMHTIIRAERKASGRHLERAPSA